jgi:hypothetical protein
MNEIESKLSEFADKIGVDLGSLRITTGEPVVEIQVSTLTYLLVSMREAHDQLTELQTRGTEQLVSVRATALEAAAAKCDKISADNFNDFASGALCCGQSIRKLIADRAVGALPMLLTCPSCNQLHVDEGEWATTRLHRTHQCQAIVNGQRCGFEWRPSNVPTVGVAKL